MQSLEADVAVKAKTNRILAIDLLRGFFLLVMVIDHLGLFFSGWDLFTGQGRLWVSAAEGFFFLSGLLIGMVYKRRLKLGMAYIFRKMWQRALELYAAGVGLTLFFLIWAEITHRTYIKDILPSPLPWHHYINQTLTSRFTYGWADFLVHFAVLMLFAPVVFYLVAKRKWWLALIGCAVVWAFRGDNFNMSWQIIFNLGIIIGFYWQSIKRRFQSLSAARQKLVKRTVAGLALATFAASYISFYSLEILNHYQNSLPAWLGHVRFIWDGYNNHIWMYTQKWSMGPLRIGLFLLWFSALYWLVSKYEAQISRASHGFVELLGRNSLFVYIAHAFIVFILKMYFIPPQTNFIQNFIITGLAMIALILATIGYKRLQRWWNSADYTKLKPSFGKSWLIF